MRGAALAGIGAHRPARREDNSAIAARTGSTDEWIRTRTGIVTRGVADDDESTVDMATAAGAKALAAAGVDAADVGLVLLATCWTAWSPSSPHRSASTCACAPSGSTAPPP